MNWHELQKAQDAAIAKTEGRELIPQGIDNRIDFAQRQIIRARTGQPLEPEEGTLWADVKKMPLRWIERPWPDD